DWEEVQADVVVIGKALSGGFYPVSAMLSRREVMDVFKPGDHGSTFGGNPLGSAVARAALDVLIDENLIDNARIQGEYLLGRLQRIEGDHIAEVRGKGLLI